MNTPDDDTIKPCPFCGGHAEAVQILFGRFTQYYVGCEECKALTALYPTQAAAIEQWNFRYEGREEERRCRKY